MISGGAPSVAAGIVPFPDPPRGSPGEISGAARGLRAAAEDLQAAHGTLGMAAGMLGSWQGRAANAYHGCVQGLARVIHGGVGGLHAAAASVSHYGAALDRAQSGMRRLRPLYDDAVRRAEREAALVAGLDVAMPNATKSERPRVLGLISGATRGAEQAVFEANGYARAAQRLHDDFQREATRDGAALAPFEMSLYGGQLGRPLGAPGPGFGLGGVNGDPASALEPMSGVVPLQFPAPHGPSVFGEILDGVQAISGVVSTVSGACSALLFWNGVGEGCGVVGGISSGIGAGAGVAKSIGGDGSLGSGVEGVVEALPGLGSAKLAHDGGLLVKLGHDTSNPVLVNAGHTKTALGGVLDGLGGTASSRSILESSGGEPSRVSAGTVDQAAGRGIAAELGQLENILAGPGELGDAVALGRE
jgi:uncharacterized protein YukE